MKTIFGRHGGMKTAVTLSLFLLMIACGSGTPPEAYQRWDDRLAASVPVASLVLGYPCERRRKQADESYGYYLPTDQCFKMTPPQRMSGTWIDELEGSRFCPGRHSCSYEQRPRIWLDWAKGIHPPPRQSEKDTTRRFDIEFVGRRTLYAGQYGHGGVFGHEIIVDRIISIKLRDEEPRQSPI